MATVAKTPSGSRRGMVQRFTGKVGPLPVWAWALLILAAGYLAYRLTAGSTASPAPSDASTADTTAGVGGGETGSPPASGGGGPADNLNETILSQLSGLSGSVDALTGLIQSTPAFAGGGDAGAGSTTPLDGGRTDTQPQIRQPLAPAVTVKKPAASPRAPAHVTYYTYKPGKAPKGQERQQAPAHGPAGTSLRFARGKGYYYA